MVDVDGPIDDRTTQLWCIWYDARNLKEVEERFSELLAKLKFFGCARIGDEIELFQAVMGQISPEKLESPHLICGIAANRKLTEVIASMVNSARLFYVILNAWDTVGGGAIAVKDIINLEPLLYTPEKSYES